MDITSDQLSHLKKILEDYQLCEIEIQGQNRSVKIKNDDQPEDVNVPLEKIKISSKWVGKVFFDQMKIKQDVRKGDILARIRVLNIFQDLVSPCDGMVEEIYVSEGDVLDYGKPVLLLSRNQK